MKGFSKKFITLFLAMMLLLVPVSAFGEEVAKTAELYITSGLQIESESIEATFEESRLVYGEALPDSVVTIRVGKYVGDVFQEKYSETLTVGFMGIFTTSIPLRVGSNTIIIKATKEGYEETSLEVLMRRLPREIKYELKALIALPSAWNGS